MRKFWFSLTILATLLLSACGQAATPAPTAAPTQAATAVPATASSPSTSSTQGVTTQATACQLYSLIPEPKTSFTIPAINDKDWSIGPEDARVVFVEYSDFQCPACEAAAPALQVIEKQYPDDVRVIFRHFPLTAIHDKANLAAQAAEAAGLQGKFWEMHNALFLKENWDVWTAQTSADFDKWLLNKADSLGLDTTKFTADLKSDAIVKQVADYSNAALAAGLNSTPSLFVFVDGKMVFDATNENERIPADPQTLAAVIELVKISGKQQKACPPTIIDPKKSYTATLKTEKGDIVIKLYADKAPVAVNSFVYLAQQKWFDNTTFHRVLANFVAQGGDPSGTGLGGPGYVFGNETSAGLLFDKAGLVGMANTGQENSNGSQFFITFAALPTLDGKYTIFGEVTKGLDVAQSLTERDPSTSDTLPAGDKLISVTIEEK